MVSTVRRLEVRLMLSDGGGGLYSRAMNVLSRPHPRLLNPSCPPPTLTIAPTMLYRLSLLTAFALLLLTLLNSSATANPVSIDEWFTCLFAARHIT